MHDGGLDLGRWPEGAGRYAERQSDVAIELGEHAEAAVRLAAGRRGQALGHLALEHECHLADGPANDLTLDLTDVEPGEYVLLVQLSGQDETIYERSRRIEVVR